MRDQDTAEPGSGTPVRNGDHQSFDTASHMWRGVRSWLGGKENYSGIYLSCVATEDGLNQPGDVMLTHNLSQTAIGCRDYGLCLASADEAV